MHVAEQFNIVCSPFTQTLRFGLYIILIDLEYISLYVSLSLLDALHLGPQIFGVRLSEVRLSGVRISGVRLRPTVGSA